MTNKKPTFEEDLLGLEEIVKKLEGGNLTLDQSMSAYESGIKLVKSCELRLEEAKGKIEKLTSVLDEDAKVTSFES